MFSAYIVSDCSSIDQNTVTPAKRHITDETGRLQLYASEEATVLRIISDPGLTGIFLIISVRLLRGYLHPNQNEQVY